MTSKLVIQFKKNLIEEIKNRPVLYDVTHKMFSNREAKLAAWQSLSQKLMMDVEMCKIMWSDLRYNYQQYVRRLRRFFVLGKRYKRKRPTMAFEVEMLFLWRFVSDKPIRYVKKEKKELNSAALCTMPIATVDLVSDDDTPQTSPPETINSFYRIISEKMKLITLIKEFPEVQDLKPPNYERINRIWIHISKKLKCKAMKCIKDWVYLRTLYEWKLHELKQNPSIVPTKCESNFLENLKFLESCNYESIYKQSLYLKKRWYRPLFDYTSILHLLNTIKDTYPGIIRTTEVYLKNKTFYKAQYHIQWSYIAKAAKSTPGQCEVSWLMLRKLYWEIKCMRSDNSILNENWFFSSMIAELYQSVYKRAWQALRASMIPEVKLTVSTKITKYFPTTPDKNRSIVEPPTKKLKVQVQESPANSTKYLVIPTAKSTKILSIKEVTPVINLLDDDDDDDSDKCQTPPTKSAQVTIKRRLDAPTQPPVNQPSPVSCNVKINGNCQIMNTSQNVSAPENGLTIKEALCVSPAATDAEIKSTPNEKLNFTINEPLAKGVYQLARKTTINFVRDILSVPSIHLSNMPENMFFWKTISKRHRMPVNVCMLFWNYLQANFHITDIAPLSELLTPCSPPIEAWKQSYLLFRDLRDAAASQDFDKYIDELPDIIKEIKKHKSLWMGIDFKHKDWDEFEKNYPHIKNLRKIWKYLRNTFFGYLMDIEKGILNKWPTEWCKVFVEMHPLVREKYEPSLPFYYIVQNQIFLEKKRCFKELNSNVLNNAETV